MVAEYKIVMAMNVELYVYSIFFQINANVLESNIESKVMKCLDDGDHRVPGHNSH